MQRGSEKMEKGGEKQKQPPNISPMKPLTHAAYGGGLYRADDEPSRKLVKPPASNTQSADGPEGPNIQPKHKPPPSTGDRDTDITGQSYIQ
ncbi:uncharacterized protein LOC117907752 [Vitis riparia]|uniref:uncharacterized protein LOC117907752 n=1 Tax=Vitis riparia TaxID=96939 RepID=UPI00155B11F0|nr:uncharacterized protein LOC117907752 [Vitis riparia]